MRKKKSLLKRVCNLANRMTCAFKKYLKRNIRSFRISVRSVRMSLAGVYFTRFVKIYRRYGIALHVPFDLTDNKFRGRFILHTYEVEESQFLSQYLDPRASVLELGGCLGFVSCLTNKILVDKEKHVVLEANPKLIDWIEKNRNENDCEFAVEHSIISAEKKNVFYMHDLIVGGSTKRQTPDRVEVEGVSFQELEKKYGTRFDTLIMDIEGGELDLLRNHKPGIARFDKIFLEVHPFSNILTKGEALECEDILSSLGFTLILRCKCFQIWEKSAAPHLQSDASRQPLERRVA